MWTAKKITADAANKMQVESGLLLNKFSVTAPTEPQDQDIICETTGDYNIKCVPQTKDLFEDVNNAPNDTAEGLRITGWDCGLTVTALSITEETIKTALGASAVGLNSGITPKDQYDVSSDFKTIYWIGDMLDPNKLFVVVMDNALSIGGLVFTSSDDGKGNLALDFKPYRKLETQDKIPMTFYILSKQGE